MTVLNYAPAPGLYEGNQTVKVTPPDDVEFFIIGTEANPPALSEYIAYDTLNPPNPFLAVTQDGKGNVVYDGGFPKFYNSLGPDAWPGFSAAPAAWKYLYNALNFCRNEVKYEAGNRKVLVLGDAAAGTNYNILDYAASSFRKTLDLVIGAAGFVPTYKIMNDYPGGKLDPTFAELDQYCSIVFFSTFFDLTGAGLITQRGVNEMVSIRLTGTGMIFITDHGNPAAGRDVGFYASANKVMINFGSRFTGDFDRTPVNVGFLRNNYGDHPLYNGMLDSESIFAGGSESQVVVTVVDHYDKTHPAPLQGMTGEGVKYLRTLAKMKDGTVKLETVIYIIGEGNAPIEPTDPDGNVIRGEVILDRNLGQPSVLLTPVPNATMFGFVKMGKDGETIVGEFRAANGVQEYYWYQDPDNKTHVGPQFRVETGDKLVLQLVTPFEYANPLTIRVDKEPSKENSFARALNKYLLRCFPITPGGSESNSYKILINRPFVNLRPHLAHQYLLERGETFEPDRPNRFQVIIADADNPIGPLKTRYGKGDGLLYDFTTDIMYRYAYTGWEMVVPGGQYTVSKFFGVNCTLVAKNSGREYFVNFAANIFRIS